MGAPFNSLLLDQSAWDMCLDANGNIAMATPPYSLAQDAASACRLYLSELIFDTSQGIAWGNVFGKSPSLVYLKAQLQAAALSVPGVASAQVFISAVTDRNVTGQVQITASDGTTSAANF